MIRLAKSRHICECGARAKTALWRAGRLHYIGLVDHPLCGRCFRGLQRGGINQRRYQYDFSLTKGETHMAETATKKNETQEDITLKAAELIAAHLGQTPEHFRDDPDLLLSVTDALMAIHGELQRIADCLQLRSKSE